MKSNVKASCQLKVGVMVIIHYGHGLMNVMLTCRSSRGVSLKLRLAGYPHFLVSLIK